MRLIDADTMRADWLENGQNEYVYDTNAVLDSIDEQPTVDAEPVRHGEWIGKCVNAGKHFVMTVVVPVCSECGTQAVNQEFTNYCPNCGAKMDGGKQDANV